ncbi:hypothetical protein OCU04_003391 [Sclerotinia nivalis]|uniref:Uncharacterized protein n=1 Tax=Sclerotinia nivalis TaxID=352851 RepID=A0A9X0ASN3_9HELO|nr:hypothetical protein OCU04_003391 [Sclerotinia nivalis]
MVKEEVPSQNERIHFSHQQKGLKTNLTDSDVIKIGAHMLDTATIKLICLESMIEAKLCEVSSQNEKNRIKKTPRSFSQNYTERETRDRNETQCSAKTDQGYSIVGL